MNLTYNYKCSFPTLLCVDNFYDNPDEVREFALSQEFSNKTDRCPGLRTKALNIINENLFNSFCTRLFSLYFDYKTCNIEWFVYTCFQKIDPFDSNFNSPLNRGWAHTDSDYLAAGVIYLNKSSLPEAGTSFYRIKQNIFSDKLFRHNHNSEHYNYNEVLELDYDIRDSFYEDSEKCNKDDYLKAHKKHEDLFEKTITVGNVYNRMIFYDSDYFHRENNFVSGFDEPRLTQVFFIKKVKTDTELPIERMINYDIEF